MYEKNVSQSIVDFLYFEKNIKHVFSVTGGGAMFLNDAFGNHDGIRAIYNHHEQASAMCGVGYAKSIDDYGLVCVTTGCGCTNAITGLLDAWQDNVPVIFISGQVKYKDTSRSKIDCQLRQLGVQEANIIEVVKSLCKYSVMLDNSSNIRYELEKALFIAKNDRPGPVWIDIPQDIQGSPYSWVDEEGYIPSCNTQFISDYSLLQLTKYMQDSQRPLVLAGNGIRISGQRDNFIKFIEEKRIPSVFSYLSIDLLSSDHELNIGRLGTKGDRAGNFAVQNCDLLLVLGSRLSIPLTGFEYDQFARNAKIIVIDIDSQEHQKNTVKIDYLVQADLRHFFSEQNFHKNLNEDWISTCNRWKSKWPVYQTEYSKEKNINMYEFINALSQTTSEKCHIVSDAGSAYYVTSQALQIKRGVRYETSGAQADMGFTIPAAIGIAIANPNKTVIGITGDGSFQMNIQELQTIKHHKLNIKLVVWNNSGYLSIKTTQKKFFNSKFAGTDTSSGLTFPDLEKISIAYGLEYVRFENPKDLKHKLGKVIDINGPCILEIICPEFQEVIPNVSAKKNPDGSMTSMPLENMYPFMSKEELAREMIVKSD